MGTESILFGSRVAPDLTFSNPDGAGSGRIQKLKSDRSRIWLKLVFGSQNNMPMIKLVATTMLLVAIEKVQLVLPLLCYCLPVFDNICRMAINFVFFVQGPILALQSTSIVRLVAWQRRPNARPFSSSTGAGRIKLAHHVLCAVKPIIFFVGLMNY